MNVQMLSGSASAVKAVINGTSQLEEVLDHTLTSLELVKLTTEELSSASNEWLASAAVWRAFAAARRGDRMLALDYVAWAMEVSAKAGAAAADAAFIAGEDTPSDFWGATYKAIAEADEANARWLQEGGYTILQDLRTRAVKLPSDHVYDPRVEAAMATSMVRSLYKSLASAGAMSRIFRQNKEANARVVEVARELLPAARRTMVAAQLRCPSAEEAFNNRVQRTLAFSLIAQAANAMARGWGVHPKLAEMLKGITEPQVHEVCEFFMGLPLEDDAGVQVAMDLLAEIGAKLDTSKDREAVLRDRMKRFGCATSLWLFVQNPLLSVVRSYKPEALDTMERIQLENMRREEQFVLQQAVAAVKADMALPRAVLKSAQRMRLAAEQSLARFEAQTDSKYSREKTHWTTSGQELNVVDREIYADTMKAVRNASQFKDDMSSSLYLEQATIAYCNEQEKKVQFRLKMLDGKLQAAQWALETYNGEMAEERSHDRGAAYREELTGAALSQYNGLWNLGKKASDYVTGKI